MERKLITMPSYEIGGIPTSLFNLLSSIDSSRLKVDVLVRHRGPYKGKMPNCTELPQNIWLSYPYTNGNAFIKVFQTFVYGIRFLLSKIPSIAAKAKVATNIPFKWYIIGGGDDKERTKIESEIQRNGVEGIVVLLGMKDNPYKYMAKSNLYVCTSSSESFPMVVNEAKALGVPVISNDFPSVYESVEDGVDGYITKIDDMPEKIAEFMETPLKITPNRIDNQVSLDAIYKLFEV